jgi:Transposase DDE domain
VPVDSTGLKLCGAGEWPIEKHGTQKRRSWRKPHISVDAGTGQIVAAEVTTNDVDDGSRVGTLLDQVADPAASFTGDAAYDRDDVYGAVAGRHPETAVVAPPRSTAVPSETAATAPTQRDRHLRMIAERGSISWRKPARYTLRALVEAAISRYQRVIGDAPRFRTVSRQATEGAIAVNALNRMLDLGRPESVRIASATPRRDLGASTPRSVQQRDDPTEEHPNDQLQKTNHRRRTVARCVAPSSPDPRLRFLVGTAVPGSKDIGP